MNTCCERFSALLKERELNFQVRELDNDETVISFPYKGKVTECFFGGKEGQYFSLYTVLERVPEEKFMDVVLLCNKLNAQYKWVTYYVDKDKDILAHSDAILSMESAADEAFEILVRCLQVTEEIKPELMRAIYA